MWQQGGFLESIKSEDAKKWIEELNQKGYAGFHDWRLPTLEEAMSLMEPKENKDGLYIKPIFDEKQRWIWTADLVKGESRAWVAFFNGGFCRSTGFISHSYIRAVRSGQSSEE